MKVTLPWPPKELNPNVRVHWRVWRNAVKEYRKACGFSARAQGVYPVDADRVHMTIRFCPPDGRRRDKSNCIAAFKAGEDGLQDALMVDDSRFVVTYEMGDITKGGAVEVDL